MTPRKNGTESRSKRSGTVYCCVYGCDNSHRNTVGTIPKITFYRFPWRPYEKERRERWILAVRRANPYGCYWLPVKDQTRICSTHFVGNERSTIAKHPAYIPTIFPACYVKSDGVTPLRKPEWFHRVKRHGSTSAGGPPINIATSGEALPPGELLTANAKKHIAFASAVTQTEDQGSGCCTVFLSASSGGSACTQVCHSDSVDAAVQAVPTNYDGKHRIGRVQLFVPWLQLSH